MAHLWVEDGGGEWTTLPLHGDDFDLAALATAPPAEPRGVTTLPGDVVLRSASLGDGGPPAWVLLAAERAGVRVNGAPLLSGIRVLRDRDEILVAGLGSVFFSTERLACVEPCPAGDSEILCPRCRQAVEPGAAAVRCPACGVWHHESFELPCWSYAATCALCSQATDLQADFRWTPERGDET